VNVERLRLVDECTSVGGEVDDGLLTDLPDGLVDRLELGGDAGDVLNGSAVGDAKKIKQSARRPQSHLRTPSTTHILFFMSSSHKPI